jgi:hypothetical protein
VVLADAEDVEAEAVRELGFGDDVAEDLGVEEGAPSGERVTSPKVSRPSSRGVEKGIARLSGAGKEGVRPCGWNAPKGGGATICCCAGSSSLRRRCPALQRVVVRLRHAAQSLD